MTTYSKPIYNLPIFNSGMFSSSKSNKNTQQLQNFSKGIKTPFIQFTRDNSVQLQASEKTSVEYVKDNIQLNVQPFKQNTYVIQNGCYSVYLPEEKPHDGYTIQMFNSSDQPIIVVSANFKMFNNLYLPKGESMISFFPKHTIILKYFETSWSLLIF